MKCKLILVAYLFTAVSPAFAQSTFEPYTINAQEHELLMKYLGEQPAKFSVPLINQFNQWEQAAQQKKATDAAKTKLKDEKK